MVDISSSKARIFSFLKSLGERCNRERHSSSQTSQTYSLENCSVRAPSVLGQHRRHSSRNSLPRFSIRSPLCRARNPPLVLLSTTNECVKNYPNILPIFFHASSCFHGTKFPFLRNLIRPNVFHKIHVTKFVRKKIIKIKQKRNYNST